MIENNKKQTNNTNWKAEDKIAALLDFPDDYFESFDQVEAMTDDEFSEKMVSLLEPCQPLPDEVQQELYRAVIKGDRLEVYHKVKLHVESSLVAIPETTQHNDMQFATESEVKENMEYRGVQFFTEDCGDSSAN